MGLTLGSYAAQTATSQSEVPPRGLSHVLVFFLIKKLPHNIDYWILTLTVFLCSFREKELPHLPRGQSEVRERNPGCVPLCVAWNQNKRAFHNLHKLQNALLFVISSGGSSGPTTSGALPWIPAPTPGRMGGSELPEHAARHVLVQHPFRGF